MKLSETIGVKQPAQVLVFNAYHSIPLWLLESIDLKLSNGALGPRSEGSEMAPLLVTCTCSMSSIGQVSPASVT